MALRGTGAAARAKEMGQRDDQSCYSQLLNSHYSVEAAKLLGDAGVADYVFRQDGAPAPTANATQAECAALPPSPSGDIADLGVPELTELTRTEIGQRPVR